MPRNFIIKLILLLSLGGNAYGQAWLNDSLLYYEYKYFKSNNDSVKQQTLVKKINLYLSQGITNTSVFNDIKRVNVNALKNADFKNRFLWNAAIVSYLDNENDYAVFFTAEYAAATNDTSVTAGLLKILVNKYTDTAAAHQQMTALAARDPAFNGLTCFTDIINYNRKHLNRYLIASAIIPGSGEALNGYVLKGLLSLAITSASVYAIVKMVEYSLYINAVLWGTGVGLKFYLGNINLTEKLFYKAEAKQKNKLTTSCELILKNILDKYPLTLKLK